VEELRMSGFLLSSEKKEESKCELKKKVRLEEVQSLLSQGFQGRKCLHGVNRIRNTTVRVKSLQTRHYRRGTTLPCVSHVQSSNREVGEKISNSRVFIGKGR